MNSVILLLVDTGGGVRRQDFITPFHSLSGSRWGPAQATPGTSGSRVPRRMVPPLSGGVVRPDGGLLGHSLG
jgi:hypothetical protein